jgi:hypothetical protein
MPHFTAPNAGTTRLHKLRPEMANLVVAYVSQTPRRPTLRDYELAKRRLFTAADSTEEYELAIREFCRAVRL